MKQAIERSMRKLLPLSQRSAWNTSMVYSLPAVTPSESRLIAPLTIEGRPPRSSAEKLSPHRGQVRLAITGRKTPMLGNRAPRQRSGNAPGIPSHPQEADPAWGDQSQRGETFSETIKDLG